MDDLLTENSFGTKSQKTLHISPSSHQAITMHYDESGSIDAVKRECGCSLTVEDLGL
jgi:hypothetical protein